MAGLSPLFTLGSLWLDPHSYLSILSSNEPLTVQYALYVEDPKGELVNPPEVEVPTISNRLTCSSLIGSSKFDEESGLGSLV